MVIVILGYSHVWDQDTIVFCGFLKNEERSKIQITIGLNEWHVVTAILYQVEEYDLEMMYLAKSWVANDLIMEDYDPQEEIPSLLLDCEMDELSCPFFSLQYDSQSFSISDHLFVHRLDLPCITNHDTMDDEGLALFDSMYDDDEITSLAQDPPPACASSLN